MKTKTDKNDKLEKEKRLWSDIPQGKAKSGRVWKEKSHKFSNLTIQNATRNSWDKKIKMKLDKKHVKEIETRMKEDKKKALQDKHKKKVQSGPLNLESLKKTKK